MANFIGENIEKISNPRILWERILADPNSLEGTLVDLAQSVGKNFDKIENAKSWLDEKILNDSRVSGRVLSVFHQVNYGRP